MPPHLLCPPSNHLLAAPPPPLPARQSARTAPGPRVCPTHTRPRSPQPNRSCPSWRSPFSQISTLQPSLVVPGHEVGASRLVLFGSVAGCVRLAVDLVWCISVDLAFEGGREGVGCGLRSGHPGCPTLAGGVSRSCHEIQALQRRGVIREAPTSPDRAAVSRVE